MAEHNRNPLTLGASFYLCQEEKVLNEQREVRLLCQIYISRITLKAPCFPNAHITNMNRDMLTYIELDSGMNFCLPQQQNS